ncbi:MAG: HlyU family transcriptional regulator [Amaricoccus sp.]
MSLLSRLFGRSSAAAPESEPQAYKDFRIFVEPIREGSRYRIAARIEKDAEGGPRSYRLIRADTCESADEAADLTLRKARQVIDEQGDALFH